MVDIAKLSRMIDICERRAREPVENLADYPHNSFNNEQLIRAASFAALAAEYREQLTTLLNMPQK